MERCQKWAKSRELRAAELFKNQDWVVNENTYFIDNDENKGREVDIRTHTNRHTDTHKPPVKFVWSMLSAEVKKSEKPWVIFSSERRFYDGIGGFGLLNHTHYPDSVKQKTVSFKDINRAHPSANCQRLGRKGYVAFSGSNNPQFFSAIVTATKACIEEHRLAKDHKEAYNDDSYDIVFYTPVVILDGKLFEAYLDQTTDGNDIRLLETQHIPYVFNYASPSYEQKSYLVDVVTLDGLSSYITKQEEWLDDVFNALCEKTAA